RNNPVTYLDPDGRADVNLANIAWKVSDKDYSVTVTFGEGANNPVKDTLKIAFEASIKAAVEGGADITSIYITCTTNGEHKNKIEHPQGWALDIGLINSKNLKNGTGVESQVQALQDKFELQPNKFRNFGPKVNKKNGVAVSDKTTIKEHDSHIHWSVKQEEKQK
ncbi:MAG: hypothetical protein MUP71_11800, partial [Candidatus Aminicenantes bacterium]|nr:hypothetical protein [Candidatus Aminicenantes bacterium]